MGLSMTEISVPSVATERQWKRNLMKLLRETDIMSSKNILNKLWYYIPQKDINLSLQEQQSNIKICIRKYRVAILLVGNKDVH